MQNSLYPVNKNQKVKTGKSLSQSKDYSMIPMSDCGKTSMLHQIPNKNRNKVFSTILQYSVWC